MNQPTMTRIIPESFSTHTTEAIYAWLVQSGETHFEVLLTRLPSGDLDDDEIVVYIMEYQAALYCGELLARVAADLSYRVPLENSRQPFCFRFTTDKLEELAETIFHLASADECRVDAERWYYYETEKNRCCAGFFNEEIEPVCYGLMPVLCELLMKY